MKLNILFDKKNLIPAIIVLVFLLIFLSISLVNHLNFRTHGLDLALHNQTLYHYAHFQWDTNTIVTKNNVLADHFGLYPMIISPFVWIFGAYTLLVFQILAIILGGIGTFKVVEIISGKKQLANISLLFFYSLWGIYSALSFDYHEVVISAMLVPWLFFFYVKRKPAGIIIIFIAILIGKENMALWGVFLMFGMALLHFKDKMLRNLSIALSVFSVFYFILIFKFVMPAFFDEGQEYLHFDYPALGATPGEALKTIFTRPAYTISLFFKNISGHESWNGIKGELHYVILLSGGIFMLLRPQFLVMLIPIYGQKLFHYDMVKWGINYHYSIEFVPILALATFYFIKDIKTEKWQKRIAILALLSCVIVTISKLEHRKSKWFVKREARFYSPIHYKTPYSNKHIRETLKIIPKEARVCAQENLTPHLALRDYIYVLPVCTDPEYVVFFKTSEYKFPFRDQESYDNSYESYMTNPDWNVIHLDTDLTIFKSIHAIH